MTTRTRKLWTGIAVGAGAMYAMRPFRLPGMVSGFRTRTVPHFGSRAGDIRGLEAATLEHPPVGSESRHRPPLRLALQLIGGGLLLYSVIRRGKLKRAAGALGMGLLTRASIGHRADAVSTSRPSERRQIVDLQKTFYIDAPLEAVYTFWADYEHFPLFLSQVRSVQNLERRRSRWSMRGPRGKPVEWTAVMTEQQPNEVLAWRSEPDAALENAGVIRFRPEGSGTRLDLRFCYRPIVDENGQTVLELLGPDPAATLNQDLSGLKVMLEAATRSETHGEKSRS